MPTYGFLCESCKSSFDVLIMSRAQADCRRVVPSMKRAFCPKCGNISCTRDFTGTTLNRRFTKSWANTVALLGNPTYDKVFERPSVDGGRNDRKVFVGTVEISTEERISNIVNGSPVIVDTDECTCDFCNPKLALPTEGEMRQKEIDTSLASVMIRGSLDGVGLGANASYNAQTPENHRAFQRYLADPEPSLPDED